MQPLDKENLFSIFEQNDEQVYVEHGLEAALDNPAVKLGMVLSGIENFQLMDLLYQRNYPKEYKLVKDRLKYKFYNKLYNYISEVYCILTVDNKVLGDSFDKSSINLVLDTMRIYYEGIEEYEKCAILKNTKDIFNE